MNRNIPTRSVNQAASKREVISWAFFDFANSGYTTVVLTTIFNAYFVAVVAGSHENISNGSATFLWTLAIAIANLTVLITAPVIGAIADHRAMKKRFLLYSTIGCVIFTTMLAFAGPGDLIFAMVLLIASAICFSTGENLISAFLPEITSEQKMGRVSGYGWSLGYFGGLLTLGICLAYIYWAQDHGLKESDFIPVTLIITAVIFALTAAPTFLWLKERATPNPLESGVSYIKEGFFQVKNTLSDTAKYPDLFRFLTCLVVFQSGVATVVVLAAVYAQEVMGFDSQQLIVLIMVVNLTAAIGAFGFGHIQDRLGSVTSLAGSLLLWITAITIIMLADSSKEVWLGANIMGFAIGASQSGGRALIGQLTPVVRSGEFFGLWGFANRLAAIAGPLSYGLINYLSNGNHRLSIISTLVFFILGLVLLFRVDEQRGKEKAALDQEADKLL